MNIVYLLYYDYDGPNGNDWNTFLTPVEAFAHPLDRNRRVDSLKRTHKDLQFHSVDVTVFTSSQINDREVFDL